MKHLLLLLFFSPLFIYAQRDSIIESSPLMKMVMQPNALIRLEHKSIGSTDDVNVEVITAYSLKDSSARRSICFYPNRVFVFYTGLTDRLVQIPVEEFSSFIDALALIEKIQESKTPKITEQYRYTSSNYTVLEMENRLYNSKHWDITLYIRYSNLNTLVPGTRIVIYQRNLSKLITLLRELEQQLSGNLYQQL